MLRKTIAYLGVKNLHYYLILVISLLVSAPLFASGLYHAHDIYHHVFRIVATIDALKDAQIIPLIGTKLANGFGYSWNIFYPPLSALIPAVFKVLFPTYTSSLKLYIFFTIVLSGITMYRFVFAFAKSTSIAVVAAILYITAPYRLVDIYIRGAMGEVLVFVFLPIFFQGVFELLKGDKSKHYYITVGMAGLILSHNVSALYSALVASIYILFYFKDAFNIHFMRYMLQNVIYTILICLFFLVPLAEHKFFGNYMVFQPEIMTSLKFVLRHTVEIYDLLFGSFDTEKTPVVLGLQFVIPLLMAPLIYKRINEKKDYAVILTLGLLSLFAITNYFPWSIVPGVFTYIQFPWRLLMFAVFFLSIFSARVIVHFFEDINYKFLIGFIFILLLYVSPVLEIVQVDEELNDTVFNVVDMVEDDSWSWGRASNEYLPVNVYENLSYFIDRSTNSNPVALTGNANIETLFKSGTNLTFRIETFSETIIELPYIYYRGWDAVLTTKVKNIDLHVSESANGLTSIQLPNNVKGSIKVDFTGTIYTKIAYVISGLTILFFVLYYLIRKQKKKYKK